MAGARKPKSASLFPQRSVWTTVADLLKLPEDLDGYRLTWKRLANLYLNRYELSRLRPVLHSRPTRLVIEPTNVCNLRCPFCHTGAGRFGRSPAMMQLEPYRRLLEEIGDYLLLIEVFNWGESLLHPDLPAIVRAASERGIATRINTHLSIALTDTAAERLVESGLTDLFVSIDGATQEVYERYRVGGDLKLVVHNCRLLAAAKQRLGSDRPRLTLQFLEFPCNLGEADAVRRLALDLDMRLLAFRGAVPDREWGQRSRWPPWFLTHTPRPCPFLWGQPVLTVDAHLAPCRGVFRSFDDFAALADSRSFGELWNNERYRRARRLFLRRADSPEDRRLPCHECPTRIFHERWRAHRTAGGTRATFAPDLPLNVNPAWNYFWARGQRTSAGT